MIYKAIDHWNSPLLAHHGVKGMKWGVRHDRPLSISGRYPRNIRRTTKKLKTVGNKVLKAVSNYDRASRLYNRSVILGRTIARNPQFIRLGSMAVAAVAAHPGVALGAAAVAGSAFLGYGVYSVMKHDDLQDSNYLEHHGVKGMKWGVRKVRETVDRIRRRNAERRIVRDQRREDLRVRRNAEAIASGNSEKIMRRMPKMTNDEIQVAINRLNMQTRLYQVNEQLNNYKKQEQSSTFFGKLMADRKKPQTNQNFNNNKDKGVIGKAIDKQIENVVNNAVEARVTSFINGENFSDTFKKKYGYKTTAEKIRERRDQNLSTARDAMNLLSIKNEMFKYSSDDLASGKTLKKRLKTGRDLYNTDLDDLMSSVNVNELGKVNFNAGQKKK